MHVAVVFAGIPNPATSGSALTNWAVIGDLLDRGHRVTACLLLPAVNAHFRHDRAGRIQRLRDQGVSVVELPTDGLSPRAPQALRRALRWTRRTAWPALADLYPWVALGPRMRDALAAARPDAIFVYEVTALAATHGATPVPRLAALVDLDHLPGLYRLRHMPLRLDREHLLTAAGIVSTALFRPRAMVRLLARCEAVVNFAAHHAAWLRAHGVPHCRYLPTPVPDPVGAGWRRARQERQRPGRPRILLIGHLGGTATVTGLYVFARWVLPELERRLGPEGFEVAIVGGLGELLPADLRAALGRPSVRFKGHVEPADDEFLSADVLLVPTPIRLGTRVRIIVGWSFGCCVVAHAANGLGIPEMVHGENALVAGDGPGLAGAVVQALQDAGLRDRLGAAGRQTFERHFTPAVVGARLMAELERIAVGPPAGRAALPTGAGLR